MESETLGELQVVGDTFRYRPLWLAMDDGIGADIDIIGTHLVLLDENNLEVHCGHSC
jgi:hypothetical protein